MHFPLSDQPTDDLEEMIEKHHDSLDEIERETNEINKLASELEKESRQEVAKQKIEQLMNT